MKSLAPSFSVQCSWPTTTGLSALANDTSCFIATVFLNALSVWRERVADDTRRALLGLRRGLQSARFFQNFVRRLERIKPGGNPAIDCRMNEHFLDLVNRHAVIQRASDMKLELWRAIKRRQHRQVQK